MAEARVALILQSPDVCDFGASFKALSDDTAWEYERRAVLELIQNGHDALRAADPGRVALVLDLGADGPALYAANQGNPFSYEDFKAISQLATSNKSPGEGIGNKGLGFRSVLELTDSPEIYSKAAADSSGFDGYSFRSATDRDLVELVPDDVDRRIVQERNPPLMVPLPAEPDDPVLAEFLGQGYSTVVKLPLRDGLAVESAREQMRTLLDGQAPPLLFLERIARLEVQIREEGKALDAFELSRSVTELPLTASPGSAVQRVDLGTHGRYLLYRRIVKPSALAEAIARSIQARQIGERWTSAAQSSADVGVAVRLDRDVETGRAYTYLPMGPAARSPLHGHIHAPFFTKLARLDLSEKVALNDFLLDEIAAATLEFALLVKDWMPFAEAASLVPDLVCWSQEQARLKNACPEILTLELAPLTDGSWGRLGDAYAWPSARAWKALTPAALSDAGVVLFDPQATAGRRGQRVEAFRKALSGRETQPPATTVARWAERVAQRMAQAEGEVDGAAWSGFYDDLAHHFSGSARTALRGRVLVLDQSGSLVATHHPDKVRKIAFFAPPGDAPPVAADLGRLGEWFCFTHPSVSWNMWTKFFFSGDELIRDYTPAHVLTHVREILATEQPEEVWSAALACAAGLVPTLESGDRAALERIAFRVPRVDKGGWIRAKDAFLSPGWGSRPAELMAELLAGGADSLPEIRRVAENWIAEPDQWPFPVGDIPRFSAFLRMTGVRDDLPCARNTMYSRSAVDLDPRRVATGFGLDEQIAEEWDRAVRARTRSSFWPDYAFMGPVTLLTGTESAERLGAENRVRFGELVLRALPSWGVDALTTHVHQPNRKRRRDYQTWPTPLATFLRTRPWLPYEWSGEPGFAAPGGIWYAGRDLPAYIKTLPRKLRDLAGREPVGRVLREVGICRWDEPAYAGALLETLGRALSDNLVPQHELAEFRRIYAKALIEAVGEGLWQWAQRGDGFVAVDTDQGLRAHTPTASAPVYVEDVESPLERSLLIAARAPVLVSEAGTAVADKAATWAETNGLAFQRISRTTVHVYDGPLPLTPDGSHVIIGDEYPWLPTVVTMVLELRGHSRETLAGEARRELAEQVRSTRIIRAQDMRIEIGERTVPSAALPPAIALPDPVSPSIVISASAGATVLDVCAGALAQLIGYPAAADSLQLVLYKIQQCCSDLRFAQIDDTDLAAAMGASVERVAELRDEITGDVTRLADLLRPVLAMNLGMDAFARLDAELDAASTSAALHRIIQANLIEPGTDPDEVLAWLRRCGSPADVRDTLGLDLRRYNAALLTLGKMPVSYPDAHELAFEAFLRRHGRIIEARVRERFHALANTDQNIDRYASASSLAGLEPDPAWLEYYAEPPRELIHAHVCDWLRGLGAEPDLETAPRIDGEDAVRSRNEDKIASIVGVLEPQVHSWCAAHGTPEPEGWADAPTRSRHAISIRPEAGLLDFDDGKILGLVAEILGWPEAMPYPPDLSVAEQRFEADTSPLTPAVFKAFPMATLDAGQRRGTVHIGGAHIDVHDAAAIRVAAAGSIDEAFLARSSPGIAPSPGRSLSPGSLPGTTTSGSYAVPPPAPEEQRRAVGLVGEEIAAIWLRREFPGSRVRWVSGYAAREGHADASDSHGYDFIVEWRGKTYFVEVKAFGETRDVVDVNLGESEVRAARAHTDDDNYKVLIVNGALEPEHDGYAVLMPNPLTPQGARQSELMGQGLRFRYHFRANQSGQ